MPGPSSNARSNRKRICTSYHSEVMIYPDNHSSWTNQSCQRYRARARATTYVEDSLTWSQIHKPIGSAFCLRDGGLSSNLREIVWANVSHAPWSSRIRDRKRNHRKRRDHCDPQMLFGILEGAKTLGDLLVALPNWYMVTHRTLPSFFTVDNH